MRKERTQSILILTSGSPATNPRMVKEANALVNRGYDVHVLYGFIIGWADKLDHGLLEHVGWTAERVGGHPESSPIKFNITRLMEKVARLFHRRGMFKFVLSRLSLPLLIRAFKENPDAIIAHNLGALPAAYFVANWKNIPLFFDAEDFHSGESNDETENAINRAAEVRFIPHCSALSAASPLISEAYQQLFPSLKVFTLNNCFSIEDQLPLIPIHDTCLRFAWFSQTIGSDRGLIEFLTAAAGIEHEIAIDITLIGACNARFLTQMQQSVQGAPHVTLDVRPPMSESGIMKVLRESHVGLALERDQPLNRDVCLTNKVFSYLLNGCQVLYSNTRAQTQFQNKYPTTGRLINLDDQASIQSGILWYMNHMPDLEEMRQNNWALSQRELHFENDAAPWFNFLESYLAE